MNKTMVKPTITVLFLLLLLSAPVFAGSVNKSVRLGDGAHSGGESSVNGSISVGSGAVVEGDLSTVNGTIRVDENSRVEDVETVNGAIRIAGGVTARDLETVNGAISIGTNAIIDGHIEAVNGRIEIDRGAQVSRDVSNINGEIELIASQVGGDISTVSGDILLAEAAVVRGNIVVEKPGGWGWGKSSTRIPKVIIGPGSRVEGDIRLEREVELYISDTATVGGVKGKLSLDDAQRFSGERP